MRSTRTPGTGTPVPPDAACPPAPLAAADLLASSPGESADAPRAAIARGYLESQERLQQIVEGLQDVVALSDDTGTKLCFVNAAYERVWGQSRETLYQDPTTFLDAVHPEDRARVRETFFRQTREEFEMEFRIVRPGGEHRWVWTRGFPVCDARGGVVRVASITEDITERKAIAESHERLLRGFTHDVKNPLGAADGYLSLLETGVFGALQDAQLEVVGRARRTIRTALTLVSQLLDIERAKSGELIVERERVDLGVVVLDCVEDYRAAANEKRHSLTLPNLSADEDLVVESDRTRVRQILANLISNAVKYTQPDGSIVISARIADGDEASRRGRWVVLSVADSGPGIPLEKQPLLFREFTRFDPGAAEGSGIGLAISQHIAHALGAEITFVSLPGAGSTFEVWVPRDAGAGGAGRSR